jgi:prepilin-type processing-associated H-X9-DG protein
LNALWACPDFANPAVPGKGACAPEDPLSVSVFSPSVNRSYAANANIMPARGLLLLGLGQDQSGSFTPLAALQQPAQVVLVSPTAGYSVWTTGIDTACCTSNDGKNAAKYYCSARFRHSGGANYALADGHAKWYRGPDRWDAQSFSGVAYRRSLAPNASAWFLEN